MSDSVRPHRRQPTRLPHPWDSPGKYTGVGCHCLLLADPDRSTNELEEELWNGASCIVEWAPWNCCCLCLCSEYMSWFPYTSIECSPKLASKPDPGTFQIISSALRLTAWVVFYKFLPFMCIQVIIGIENTPVWSWKIRWIMRKNTDTTEEHTDEVTHLKY